MSRRNNSSRSDRNYQYNQYQYNQYSYGQEYQGGDPAYARSTAQYQVDTSYYPNLQAPFYAEPYQNNVIDDVSLPQPSPNRSPSPAPIPTEASPLYLSESLKPSKTLSDAAPRKLLILDLNGTLLFRSPRTPFKRKPRSAAENNELAAAAAPDAQQYQDSRLRPVHPRPYMGAFRSYLFAPQTRAWLDTMVWSSAQPHSVNDMVEKCFGKKKNQLVAVWARDTLGLSSSQYHHKSHTTKDLAKPWAQLPVLSNTSPYTPQAHSALTTLLLDDSPRKARLQPWNHVCIAEYVGQMRAQDLKLLTAQKVSEQLEMIGDEEAMKGSKKYKTLMQLQESSSLDLPPKYDETLLSVIGILDAVKRESNVAGWIRAGGLWGEGGRLDKEDDVDSESDSRKKKKRDVYGVNDAAKSSSPFPSSGSGEEAQEEAQEMWFEHEPTMEYWAGRGRAALEELRIEVGVGIEK